MREPKVWARVAGLLYVFNIVSSVFALVVTDSMFVPNDATQTAANILASEQMFRAAIVAILLANVAYVAVIAILLDLMKPAGPTLSRLAGFVGLTGCGIAAATGVGQISALHYLGDASYLAAFSQDQLHSLARIALRAAGAGNTVALLFFGVYCLLLARLAYTARFLPRWLSFPLTLAGLGWLVGVTASLMVPSLSISGTLIPVSGIGELLFTLWILIKGVDQEKWHEQSCAVKAELAQS